MITTTDQYNANLHLLNNNNPPTYATLPNADNIYNIDIKNRIINAPKFLCVEKDHASETIYFIVDRYADYMDLSKTNCIITYTNALGKSRMYCVPFYDIYTYAAVDKMIIPWCLDVNVAEAAGTVEFFIQFFQVGEVVEQASNNKETRLLYSLNTLPASSQVLPAMEVSPMGENYKLDFSQYQELCELINSIGAYRQTYWTFLD